MARINSICRAPQKGAITAGMPALPQPPTLHVVYLSVPLFVGVRDAYVRRLDGRCIPMTAWACGGGAGLLSMPSANSTASICTQPQLVHLINVSLVFRPLPANFMAVKASDVVMVDRTTAWLHVAAVALTRAQLSPSGADPPQCRLCYSAASKHDWNARPDSLGSKCPQWPATASGFGTCRGTSGANAEPLGWQHSVLFASCIFSRVCPMVLGYGSATP